MGNTVSTGDAAAHFENLERILLGTPFLNDPEKWSQFWSLSEEEEHVWLFFSFDFMSELKEYAPFNLASVICLCLATLSTKVYSSHPLYAGRSESMPLISYEHSSTKHIGTKQLLLCLRVLTRIMTFLHATNDEDDFEYEFMWRFRIPAEMITKSMKYYQTSSFAAEKHSTVEDSMISQTKDVDIDVDTSLVNAKTEINQSEHDLPDETSANSVHPEEYGSDILSTPSNIEALGNDDNYILEDQIQTALLTHYQTQGAMKMSRLVPGKQLIHLLICLGSMPGFSCLERDLNVSQYVKPILILVDSKKLAEQNSYPSYHFDGVETKPLHQSSSTSISESSATTSASPAVVSEHPTSSASITKGKHSLNQASVFPNLLWNIGLEPMYDAVPMSYEVGHDIIQNRRALLLAIISTLGGSGVQALKYSEYLAKKPKNTQENHDDSDPTTVLNDIYRGYDEYVQEFVSMSRTLTPTLFYSLMNTACCHSPIDVLGKILPYGYSLSDRTELDETIATLSIAVLSRCMNYATFEEVLQINNPHYHQMQKSLISSSNVVKHNTVVSTTLSTSSISDKELTNDTNDNVDEQSDSASISHIRSVSGGSSTVDAGQVSDQDSDDNIFRILLASLSSSQIRVFTFHCLDVLANPIDAESTWLPNSAHKISFVTEFLLFLFQCLETAPRFLEAFVAGGDSSLEAESPRHLLSGFDFSLATSSTSHSAVEQIIRVLLFHLYEAKSEPKSAPTLYISMFILLRCSSYREFCVALNTSYVYDLPLGLYTPNVGEVKSYSDLLINILCIILSKSVPTDTLFTISLLILCNITPYTTCLQSKPSEQLLNITEQVFSERFVLSNYNPYQYMTLLAESLSSLLQYQYHGSAELFTQLLQRSHIFVNYHSAESFLESINNCQAKYDEDYAAARLHAARNEHYTIQAPLVLFKQTSECIIASYQRLNLLSVLRFIKVMKPKMDPLFKKGNSASVANYLRNTTIVGVLPQPHPITMRKYVPNINTDNWFSNLFWVLLQSKTKSTCVIELFGMAESRSQGKTCNNQNHNHGNDHGNHDESVDKNQPMGTIAPGSTAMQ